MPPLVVAIAAVMGGGAFAVFAATLIVNVMVMTALSMVAKMLAPSSSQGSQLSDGVTQEYSGTVEPRRILYGQNLVSGLNAIPPWCHGTNNQMLDQVLVLAGHECAAVLEVYANQELIPSTSIGAITQSLNDGKVSTGTFANKLWLRRHTGAPSEQIDFILYSAWPSAWDVNHIGQGLAKLFIQYQYDATVYSGGKPEIRVMVKGKKVYDPRLDTLPGANTTNPAYFAYTANAALCTLDFILDPILGVGEAPGRIDWTMAVAAANVCDELVAIPGSLTQPRYTCNTVLDCTVGYEDNLKTLAASMQGAVLYSSGKWVLYPGKWQTPSFAIGDDDIAGAIDYQTAIAYADRYNAVRGQFYDPANLYQPSEYPAIEVIADEIADAEGPVWRELQQPHCVDIFEAQRNAIILQRKSRRKKTWAFPATYGMYAIRPGDFGTLTVTELGIAGQYVRCTGWKLDGKAMTVQLALEEVNSADWFDPAPVVYQTAANLASPAPATFVSDPVTQFTAVGGAGGITFRWLMPPIWHSNLTIELLESDVNNVTGAVVIWSGVNTGVFIQKYDTTTRYYWVRVRNFAGNTLSGATPGGTTGLAASALSVAGPPGPAGPPGSTGEGGLVGSLTVEGIVLPANALGHVTDYSAAAGNFVVYLGTVDVTAQCTFALAPAGNPSGLTFTIDGNSGEASEGVITSAQAQSTVGATPLVNPVGTGASAQAQSTLGAGGGLAITFDSGQLTWDSSHLWSDNGGATAGTPGITWDQTLAPTWDSIIATWDTSAIIPLPIPVAVSGAGSTAQAETQNATGTVTAPSGVGAPKAPANLYLTMQGQNVAGGQGTYSSGPPAGYAPVNPNRQDLAWTAAVAGSYPVDHYVIERNANGAGWVSYDTSATLGYTDFAATLCVNGVAGASPPYYAANTYLYRVSAVDTHGQQGPPSPTQSFVLYADGVLNWAGDYNFGGTSNYTDSSGAPPTGTKDMLYTNTNWGGWLPYSGNKTGLWNMNVGAFNNIEFDLKPTATAGTLWEIYALRVGDVNIFTATPGGHLSCVFPGAYGPPMVANTWTHYKIPLSKILTDYGPSGAGPAVLQKAMYKFCIKNGLQSGGNWFINNVTLTPDSTLPLTISGVCNTGQSETSAGNGTYTAPSGNTYKFPTGDAAMSIEYQHNTPTAQWTSDIDVLTAHPVPGGNTAQTYIAGWRWNSLESGALGTTPVADAIAGSGRFAGFQKFLACYTYLQSKIPGAKFGMSIMGVVTGQTLTAAKITAGNFSVGMPSDILTCGGSLTVPSSLGSGSTTTYPVASIYSGSTNYGFGFNGWTGTVLTVTVPAWWNPGINQRWINFWEALSLFQYVAPPGHPLAGRTLTIDTDPCFVYPFDNDEYSYAMLSGYNPTDAGGVTVNPPRYTSAANQPTNANMIAAYKLWAQKVVGFFPHTPVGTCFSFGFQASSGNDTPANVAAYLNEHIGDSTSLSTIKGLAFSNSDTYGGDFVGTPPVASSALQGYIGIASPLQPTGLGTVTNTSLAGYMPIVRQVQPIDYGNKLPSGTPAWSAAAVISLANAANSTRCQANLRIWCMGDGSTYGNVAWTSYIQRQLVAGVTPFSTVRPSNLP